MVLNFKEYIKNKYKFLLVITYSELRDFYSGYPSYNPCRVDNSTSTPAA